MDLVSRIQTFQRHEAEDNDEQILAACGAGVQLARTTLHPVQFQSYMHTRHVHGSFDVLLTKVRIANLQFVAWWTGK
jgi:hypothetical protein